MKRLLDSPFMERWRRLDTREQTLVAGAGILLLIVIFYLAVWAPLRRELNQLRTLVPQEHNQLALMRVQARQVSQLKASGRASAAGDILSTLEQSAVANGLRQQITRMEPDSGDGARLEMGAINFNALIKWLNQLHTQSGVRVETATLEASETPGMVNVHLVLRSSE